MSNPVYYQVTQKQVGREDLTDFLRKAIAKQFDKKEYYVAKEVIETRATPYSKEPRKLRGFLINESNTVGHAIYFDVTNISDGINWLGR
tara:strand:- start:271 stop:537 length:267 start_codon:yes stop_codon:yes gene_type:complete